MSAIRFDRLLRLAQHLEKPQESLGADTFYFAWLQANAEHKPVTIREELIDCGTVGCALGELPYLWPDEFQYDEAFTLCQGDRTDLSPFDVAQSFFGLAPEGVDHLFYPGGQRPGRFGGNRLDEDATKEEVAANIRAFVAKMQGDEQ